MTEGPNRIAHMRGSAATESVDMLVSRVLTVVASRAPQDPEKRYDELVSILAGAVRSMDHGAPELALEALREAGCTTDEITDIYIPAAARLLGDEWCSDQLSFADVTIGVARLQSILREFEREWFANSDLNAETGSALMIVCQDEFHTLGAMVIAGQMRRMGVSVRLSIGQTHSERLEMIMSNDFDMVMISASRTENLETTRELVKNIRTASGGRLPIVLGGTVLDQNANIQALTGADHVVNDPKEALRLCGLKTHHLEPGLSGIGS